MRPQVSEKSSSKQTRAVILPLALLAVVVGLQSASAALVNLDSVVVFNTAAIAGDAFDNGIFDAPPWFVVSGAPGPESGETLEMHHGDFIYLPLITNREADLTAFSHILLTDFPAGSVATMFLFGGQPGELLSLSVIPGQVILADGTGAILGSAVLPPISEAEFLMTLVPHGPELFGVTAAVNDVQFALDFKVGFGTVAALGISIVPEPATLGLLGLGCVIMGARRRLRRQPNRP